MTHDDNNKTQTDLSARSSMATGMVLDAVTTHEDKTARVYQFAASHPLSELTARGWASLLSVEVARK